MGCDRRSCVARLLVCSFQSTHPRGVRPRPQKGRFRQQCVSIHAPAWGATSLTWIPCRARVFQSTHPRGVRQEKKAIPGPFKEVSIHAPAWGATAALRGRYGIGTCFNPRTRVGCDISDSCSFSPSVNMFQSTHPRGVRRGSTGPAPRSNCFNPRTRVGCDLRQLLLFSIGEHVSIHAPAWGATVCVPRRNHGPRVSIHAPAWGATCAKLAKPSCTLFQSTHPRGVRPDNNALC